MQSKKALGIIVLIVFVIGIVVLVVHFGSKSNDMATDQAQTTTPVTDDTGSTGIPPATTIPSPSASKYKDGTYTATGSYQSPGGPDQVKVTLTLANDVVTDATVVGEPGDNTSKHYQDLFISGYKAYVVGKNIDDVMVGKVSGSSLTSIGFNDALARIKAQAMA